MKIDSGSSLATAAAIAVIAYALADVVHEAGGHWLMSVFVPGVHAVSISTVALSTRGSSRLVAAAGTVANVVAGGIAMGVFSRRERLTRSACLLWLFGAVSLMNIGYLIYSGVFAFGDWHVVVTGLPAERIWHIAMIIIGIAGYIFVVRLSTRLLATKIAEGRDARRVIMTSYVAGSVLMLAGAAMNPLKQFILLSGLATGFACTAGLLFVSGAIGHAGNGKGPPVVEFNATWIVAGALVAAMFVFLLGPGISLTA